MANNTRFLNVLVARHMAVQWVVCVEDRPGEINKVFEHCKKANTGAKYKLCLNVPFVILKKVEDPSKIPVHVIWLGNDFGNIVRVDVGETKASSNTYPTILRTIKWESQTVRNQKAYLERRSDVMTRGGGSECHPKGFIDPAEWDKYTESDVINVQHDWDKSNSCTTSVARHTDGKGIWLSDQDLAQRWSKQIRPSRDLGISPSLAPLVLDIKPWDGPAVPDSPMDYDYDQETMDYLDPARNSVIANDPHSSQHILPESQWMPGPPVAAAAAPRWFLGLTETGPSLNEADEYWTQTF